MMTFDEWWETISVKISMVLNSHSRLALKPYFKNAWHTSRNCSKCNRDLKLKYCPNCQKKED